MWQCRRAEDNPVPCTTASWLGSVTPSFFFPICLVMLMAAVAVNRLTNKIYAANSGSNTVTIIDGSANSTSTLSVGYAPEALSLNPVTNKVYVANRCGADALCGSNQNRFQSRTCRGKPCGRLSCGTRYLAVSLGYFRLENTTFPPPGSDPSGYLPCMGVLRNVVWCFEPDRPAKGDPHQNRIVSLSAPGFDSWRILNENSKQQLTLLAARFGLAETNNFNPMHRHRGDVHLGSYRSGAQPGPASSLHRYNLESADPGWHMDGQLQFDLSARAQHGATGRHHRLEQ